MKVTVQGKNLDIGDSLRDHAHQAVQNACGKYFDDPLEASVVVEKDSQLFRTHISVHVGKKLSLQGEGRDASAYESVNQAVEHLAKRLRRRKRRIRDHHPRAAEADWMAPTSAP